MTDLEVQAAMDDDAFLGASDVRSGEDRRASARIPLTKPVRVGPPGGFPQSPVSAADLSSGGLFIDADRPVRVGARFSVQVPLASGASVYVEEAEVVYNRQTSSAPGFGVRFIRMNPASAAAIVQEIERLSSKALRNSPRPATEDLPTLAPAAFGGDVAVHPSSHRESILEQALDIDASSDLGSSDLSTHVRSSLPRWLTVKDVFKRNARRVGLALAAVAAATVLAATVVFVWSNRWAPEGHEERVVRTAMPADTHRALMKAEAPATKVVPPPPTPAAARPKRRLPELTILDDPKPAPPVKRKRIQRQRRRSKVQRAARSGNDKFTFRLSPNARVRRTMVYRAPERVVIDLFDQAPFRPKVQPSGHIRRFRVGRHPNFIRLVLDAERPIKKATATMDGRELRVSVTYRGR